MTAVCHLRTFIVLATLIAISSGPGAAATRRPPGPLSLDERIAFQGAIEQVYYRHRIWPKENPRPKPPFEELMPPTQLRAKVEDYLRKSIALEAYWKRPVTAEQLQAEMDRMARDTKDPAVLRELFAALDNDPHVIAECLARPSLVDRLIHGWYANDSRLHAEVKAAAERDLAALQVVGRGLVPRHGRYEEVEWVKDDDAPERGYEADRNAIRLSSDEWDAWTAKLPAALRRVSVLQEDEERFYVTAVLTREPDRLRVATVSWSKVFMDAPWQQAQAPLRAVDAEPSPNGYVRPGIGSRAGPCTLDTWTPMRFSPAGRENHSAVWTGSEMIVWGGYDGNGSTYFNTGSRYAPSTDTWAETSSGVNVPTARQYHTAVWTGTDMIVWGGSVSGTYLDTGGRYNPMTDSWVPTSTGANVPSPRAWQTAIWTGSEMIVWGGVDQSGYFNTGGRYDPAADSWVPTSTGANVPSPRVYHTAVWTGSELVIWGGVDQTSYLNTGGRYDPAADSWLPTSAGANVPIPRYRHSAVWSGSDMIVWGGANGFAYLNTGSRYSPATDSWAQTSMGANVPDARSRHTAVWTGSAMIVWGGWNSTGEVNTGGRYDASADSWTATSTGANVPAARRHHTAIWAGSEMIVWGGLDVTQSHPGTGGRYDPASDFWVPTRACPSARARHTAIWTGSEMIVWGGEAPYSSFDTGGRYIPTTDSWVATSTGANVPASRYDHTAVWTGSDMIVWGGYDGASSFNTGGRYDPATDSWVVTSTGANVPLARSDHTAIWTGSEMIVWGGWRSGMYLKSGGRYDPATDSWVATSTGANVPSGRRSHTAVWTGSEMIVWGGDPGLGNTGGRYFSATDSWAATSTGPNVPSARYEHTAVWTGREMIIWGGYGGSNGINTGGRYDPATDSWEATSTGGGVPAGRYRHTAAWTGSEMIVWGGVFSPPDTSGGRYGPVTDSWAPTSMGGTVPAPRSSLTAIWTGGEMIVWGGAGPGGYRDTGALYCGCPPIALSPATLLGGLVGQPYSQAITASGGTAPYAYVVAIGMLPPGLSLSPVGVLSGTPTASGTWSFTVAAIDSNGCAGSHDYALTIDCPAITLSPATLPAGTVGSSYSQSITASGGTPSYTFAVTSGSLPPGLSLSPGGVLSGTPTTKGSYGFAVTATDSFGCEGSLAYSVGVNRLVDYVVGQGLGQPNPNEVKLYTGTGAFANVDFLAYGAGSWGVNVAGADVELGPYEGMLTGPGPGRVHGPHVRAFRRDGAPIAKVSFYAYGTLRYGVNVASGSTDNDAYDEIISGAGPGAVFGPHVRGFNYDNTALSAIAKINFYAYGTLKYGVNVSTGNVDGDAWDEILTGAGPGPVFASTVRGFDVDGGSVSPITKINYNAFSYVGYGVNVAGGDVDGDSYDEIAATPGPGPTHPSRFIASEYGNPLPGFDITPFSTIYGGRVGVGDLTNDGREDLLCGPGRDSAAVATVRSYDYAGGTLTLIAGTPFNPFPSATYGVNVAATEAGY